ncbi:hypothetical protein KIN20_012109 [Parelaphostrongylus tenuis]|uniref:Uncharacterized protein n=1 Tax=Parelaphostrongylus tenuis TaxID=148309 RepID=A0AAD5QMN6_PARTN|nr:hypothetical protein KIN20_012109 [Parelaphostrongylus tenuis]
MPPPKDSSKDLRINVQLEQRAGITNVTKVSICRKNGKFCCMSWNLIVPSALSQIKNSNPQFCHEVLLILQKYEKKPREEIDLSE